MRQSQTTRARSGGVKRKFDVSSNRKVSDFFYVKKASPSTSAAICDKNPQHSGTNAKKSPDIGSFVKTIDESTKAFLLDKPWQPPSDYNFPYSYNEKNGNQKMYAKKLHLDKFDWLVLSDKDKGFYCKYCFLFAPKDSTSNTLQERLVKKPLTEFDKLLGNNGLLQTHQQNQYHTKAVEEGKLFLNTYLRECLRPGVKTMIFCGRQNISLRILDKKEDNETDEEYSQYILDKHKNKLIDICKEIIQENILKNVKEAKFFSVIFDETTDDMSQLSVSFRYLQNGRIREDLVNFCDKPAYLFRNIFGAGNRIQNAADFELDLKYCVGIASNCSVVTSKAAFQELQTAVCAKRFSWSSHILNYALATSPEAFSCRNAVGTMRKVVEFVNGGCIERRNVFKKFEVILQDICESHDGHQQFQGDNLVNICCALKEISSWPDSKTATEAYCLLQTLHSADFIVSTVCLHDVLGVTVSLSRVLESSSTDLKKATDDLDLSVTVLQEKRENAHDGFKELYEQSKNVAEKLKVKIIYPKTDFVQTRSQTQAIEEYFCDAIYVPLLDSAINELIDRLSPEINNSFQLRVFIPNEIDSREFNEDIKCISELTKFYEPLFENNALLNINNEYKLWIEYWRQAQVPQSIFDLIKACDADMYPNIKIFLRILATLPLSVTTGGKLFSTTRRQKTWLRASINEKPSLAPSLLHAHKDIHVDAEKVIDRFVEAQK